MRHVTLIGLVLVACSDPTTDERVDPAACVADPPLLSCPEDLRLDCVAPEGAPLAFSVQATGCTEREPAITCSHRSGDVFVPGAHSIVCTAIDPATDRSSTCSFTATVEPSTTVGLECTQRVEAECTGERTLVAIDPPRANSSCGVPLGSITDDAPSSGFPVGSTAVEFTAQSSGTEATCSTVVQITDSAPPILDCPHAARIVRDSPASPFAPSLPTVRDNCDSAPTIATSPEIVEPGVHRVVVTATDDSGLRSMCDLELSVANVFAPTGLRVVSASLNDREETDVTLAWNESDSDDTAGYTVERAAVADGPWTSVGTVSRGTLTYTDVEMPLEHAYYRLVARSSLGEPGGSTDVVEAYAIREGQYDLREQIVPTLPFATTLYGVVRHPASLADGPFPLVLMMHGNHGICRETPTSADDFCATSNDHECPFDGYFTTPNAEGLIYLAETLAARGFLAVSISANAMNCRADYIPERTQLLLEHLRRWSQWNSTDGESPFDDRFRGRVDLTRVALIGHSRGGEAVSLAPDALEETPVASVTLRSIFAIAPVDNYEAEALDADYAVLLPSCDGDVSSLDGLHIYDRSISSDHEAERAQVLFSGANHNFFNTEWRLDDNAGTVCPSDDTVGGSAQQGMLEGVVGTWLQSTLREEPLPAFVRGEANPPDAIVAWADHELDLRWSYASPQRHIIDRFDGEGAPNVNLLGESNTFRDFRYDLACHATECGLRFPHDAGAAHMSWETANAIVEIGLGSLDATLYEALSFRMASRQSTFNEGMEEQDFSIRVRDSDGRSAEMRLSEVAYVPHGYLAWDPRDILQTVRVPIETLRQRNPDLATDSLASLSLLMTAPDHARGSVVLTDVELAGR